MPELDIPNATETTTDSGESTTNQPRSFWHKFEGKEVVVQLREGVLYATVDYPNLLRQHPDPKAPMGTPYPTQFIRGILRVLEDRGSPHLRLCVETDVKGSLGHMMVLNVLFHPDDTAFVTIAE
jgi:hypothetical protein